MKKEDFDLLVESLEQALAHKNGESTVRTITRTKADLSGRGIPVHLKKY